MKCLSDHYILQFDNEHDRLQLINSNNPKQKPFYIDFCAGKMAYRTKQGIGRNEPLARAVGIKKEFIPTVLDATAGLGRDAFVLAQCGCNVTMLERNEIIYQLLQDALRRAASIDAIKTMQLRHIAAQNYLEQLTDKPDVIYLDPMYPERNKTALVKQEMRIIRDLVGDDEDINTVFELALQRAKQRVVVKRHQHAESLLNRKPSHSIEGKTTRFDVYIPGLSHFSAKA